jgi:hypothetical protein
MNASRQKACRPESERTPTARGGILFDRRGASDSPTALEVIRTQAASHAHGWDTFGAVFALLRVDTEPLRDYSEKKAYLLTSAAANTRWDIVCDNLNIHLRAEFR